MDISESQVGPMDHRTRRPHKKSRYGCSKCRERRIKCDEAAPRCSRCEKKDLVCEYPRKRGSGPISPNEYAGQRTQPGHAGSPDYSATSSNPWSQSSATSSPRVDGADSLVSDLIPNLSTSLRTQASQRLHPTDFELFEHFLDHTSKDSTVDHTDQYTLQVGIPSLALQCEFLMKSLLALAGVCRCCDIIRKPQLLESDRENIIGFLRGAQQYHMESMHEVQATRHGAARFDHVLANAAMMGMYGSSSHWVRIWLLKTSTSAAGDPEVFEFQPNSTEWVRLFRAVTTAYNGLRFDIAATSNMEPEHPVRLPSSLHHENNIRLLSSGPAAEGHQSQTPLREHVLQSIITATVGSAMTILRDSATKALYAGSAFSMLRIGEQGPVNEAQIDQDVQACFEALEILEDITRQNFSAVRKDVGDNHPDSGTAAFEAGGHREKLGQLAHVSPWVQRYTSSITSMVPSGVPRRYIAAFVHKSPLRYLDIVEEVFALQEENSCEALLLSRAQQLALNIFAHWLVLVLLLDDVWWIGGVGAWELCKIVSVKKRAILWQEVSWNNGDGNWWPESTLEIWRHLDSFSKG